MCFHHTDMQNCFYNATEEWRFSSETPPEISASVIAVLRRRCAHMTTTVKRSCCCSVSRILAQTLFVTACIALCHRGTWGLVGNLCCHETTNCCSSGAGGCCVGTRCVCVCYSGDVGEGRRERRKKGSSESNSRHQLLDALTAVRQHKCPEERHGIEPLALGDSLAHNTELRWCQLHPVSRREDGKEMADRIQGNLF